MIRALLIIVLFPALFAASAVANDLPWQLVFHEDFSDPDPSWFVTTEPGNPCSEVLFNDPMTIRSECSCGASPAVVTAIKPLALNGDWRV